ncbi:MAG: ABC transporter ATP-binding protein [Trueperaceae bacterium]|nr:ABC transporter ATP-binding protein [Trueperaceae bacterium]
MQHANRLVIELTGVVKRYGRDTTEPPHRAHALEPHTNGPTGAPLRARALDGVDLQVRAGEIFGFLGPNGAGKTTTIRLLLDLLRPTLGKVRVFGQDPRSAGPALRRRIGYLPGDVRVGTRQSAHELLTHLGQLRGGVSDARIRSLAERLGLDLRAPIRRLSKGNRQKVGLIQAFMHDPELLVLDEPTSGLDPLLQREFLAMVREASDRGRTVFMSSHVLSEVEQVADRTGIIRDGHLVAVESVDELRTRAVRRVEVVFGHDLPDGAFSEVSGLEGAEVHGRTLRGRLTGPADSFVKAAARHEVVSFLAADPDLEELFFTYYAERGGRHAA